MYEKKTVYTPAVYRVNNYEYRCRAVSLGLLQIAVYEQNGQVHVSAIKPEKTVAPVRNSEISTSGHELQEQPMKLIESFNREN